MELKNKEAAIEAILFASGEPIELDRIAQAADIDIDLCKNYISAISERYSCDCCGIELIELNGSYQICSKGAYFEEIKTALKLRSNAVLSDVAIEALAIIAYNQPVTRSLLEEVRGVDCSYIVGSLCEKRLIEEKGRMDIPGRPMLYGTTDNFLRCFNLKSLDELPRLPKLGSDASDDQITLEEIAADAEKIETDNI